MPARDDAEQQAAWDFLAWLNGPESGKDGASAMADILQSMGILPSRTSDVAAYQDALGRPFLEGYVSTLANAQAFPIVLGGQEFSEALQQVIEQLQYGQITAEEAAGQRPGRRSSRSSSARQQLSPSIRL